MHIALRTGMRTNIVIDDALVKLEQQAEIRALRGRLNWEGDLEAQRLDGQTEAAERQP
jgi:hypothetical protein